MYPSLKPCPFECPKFNDIVTYDGHSPGDDEFIYLSEYNFLNNNGERIEFEAKWFVELPEVNEIHALLSAVPQTTTV